ncbi:MAG: DNA mismatch repair protein MutS [Eubacteriales bacterium]
MAQLTPMMQQYIQNHEKVKDAILFFRLGDFYEMFFDDALTASKELEITLTGRDCGLEDRAPMCGVPYHAAENYIARLIEKGYKVAICEQIGNPKDAKGIVKRDIVRIISPGTIVQDKLLENKSNNYLMSIYYNMVDFGIAYVDLSTGEFYTTQLSKKDSIRDDLIDEIAKINPSEILINTVLYQDKAFMNEIEKRFNIYVNVYAKKYFQLKTGIEEIMNQFIVHNMSAIGLEGEELSIRSCGALLTYLRETQMNTLHHMNKIYKYKIHDYMAMDLATRNNLELTQTMRHHERKGSLLGLLDRTNTAMGGRRLKNWINEPLVNIDAIQERLDAVQWLLEDVKGRDDLKIHLKKIYDLERLTGKIALGNCNARDLLALKQSLEMIPSIREVFIDTQSHYLKSLSLGLDELQDVVIMIDKGINPDAPNSLKEGHLIKKGYHEEVDYYRKLTTSGKDFIVDLENRERENTGIKSLKIKYNRIFGYYIDITKSNLHLVPDHYIRKQTLANSERYYTEELKDVENKILSAEEKIIHLEYEIFQNIKNDILLQVSRIKKTSENISIIDTLYSFAQVSFEYHYAKPTIYDGQDILIYEGRHPVVENVLPQQEFVPNSCELNCSDQRMVILTGPNMAGKSTYIRQVAIITLMAQIGCYIPAQKGKIGVVDRIFTRVGASDDLALGHSTFMVEMSEVSNILKNATQKSLVILDEIGRGTSTYDGLSIAWSVVEYLSNKETIGCKTLFATHYHELTQLEDIMEGVRNFSIKVKESHEGVTFLRKIVPGGADQSYGIEVAKLAGLPKKVVQRAREILNTLENSEENNSTNIKKPQKIEEKNDTINLFNYKEKRIIDELTTLPIEEMTPMEVMNYIYNLKKKLQP